VVVGGEHRRGWTGDVQQPDAEQGRRACPRGEVQSVEIGQSGDTWSTWLRYTLRVGRRQPAYAASAPPASPLRCDRTGSIRASPTPTRKPSSGPLRGTRGWVCRPYRRSCHQPPTRIERHKTEATVDLRRRSGQLCGPTNRNDPRARAFARTSWTSWPNPGVAVAVSYSPTAISAARRVESRRTAASGQPPHESDCYTTSNHLPSRVRLL
jgi:hypothetical protein